MMSVVNKLTDRYYSHDWDFALNKEYVKLVYTCYVCGIKDDTDEAFDYCIPTVELIEL
jgi:hypothetical protein